MFLYSSYLIKFTYIDPISNEIHVDICIMQNNLFRIRMIIYWQIVGKYIALCCSHEVVVKTLWVLRLSRISHSSIFKLVFTGSEHTNNL